LMQGIIQNLGYLMIISKCFSSLQTFIIHLRELIRNHRIWIAITTIRILWRKSISNSWIWILIMMCSTWRSNVI
jgi:hypothetical protein